MKDYKTLIMLLFVSFFLVNCDPEDDPVPEPTPTENLPPTAFNPLSPTDAVSNMDLQNLYLEWEASTDPEGGAITYNVYLLVHNFSIYVGPTLSDTELTLDSSYFLYPYANYYWYVAASDPEGNTTGSGVFSFKTRELIHTVQTAQDQIGDFYEGALVHFNGKFWIFAPKYNSASAPPTKEMWSSENGINWVSHPWPSFSPRFGHTLTVFDGKMWVIGGLDASNTPLNEIWYTTDGENWVDATPTSVFLDFHHHSTVVFNGKMYIIGTKSGSFGTEVWSSPNGLDWTMETNNAFPRINYGEVVVYNGKLYAIGGKNLDLNQSTNAIYKSENGVHWEEVNLNYAFTPTHSHTATVFRDKVWLLGGGELDAGGTLTHSNEIWYSDGELTEWHLYGGPDILPKIYSHHAMVYEDELWVFGGLNFADALGEIGSFY
jgi:hypothetical protein